MILRRTPSLGPSSCTNCWCRTRTFSNTTARTTKKTPLTLSESDQIRFVRAARTALLPAQRLRGPERDQRIDWRLDGIDLPFAVSGTNACPWQPMGEASAQPAD